MIRHKWPDNFLPADNATGTATFCPLCAILLCFLFRSWPHPYIPNPEEDVDWLVSLSQKKSWSDHKACCWIYYQTAATDLELAQCVIAKVAVELLDANCTGVFMPSEFALIPGEIASEELRSMAAYRSSESSI